MLFRAPLLRTVFEACLPACLLLAGLMFITRGDLSGVSGLLTLLAIAFPGLWGALRLRMPQASSLVQAGYSLIFCTFSGLSVVLTLLATRFILQALGLYTAARQGSDLGKLVPFALAPGIVFLALRGGMALVKAARRWQWRGCPKRVLGSVALLAVLAALGAAGYAWASRPYTGHAASFAPNVLASTLLIDFGQPTSGWQAADPTVQIQTTDGVLKLIDTASTVRPYSVAWQFQAGALGQANGLRISASSGVATSLRMEVEETGGGRYNTWADLAAGENVPVTFANFVTSLQAIDENGRLDWDQVARLTLSVYPETAGASLQLDKIETLTLEETPWLVFTSPHFWIRYHASDQAVVADVQQAAESRFESLAAVLGFRPTGRIAITIVATHVELEQQVGQPRPGWVVGTATPDALIVLTPRRFSPWFNRRSYATIFELVPHELTHLLLVQKVGYPGFLQVPGWLNEGLAAYLAGQNNAASVLRQDIEQGKLPTLNDLNAAFTGQAPVGEYDYAAAASASACLAERYGTDKISSLLESLAHGSDFETAFETIVGIDLAAFEQVWLEWVMAGTP
ncbi:MAG: peptidase MA family metallohydrolase [Chloroflexota bacterium]